MKQSSEMRCALEFATAQSCRERSLESVNRVADIGFSDFVQVTGNTTFFCHFGFFPIVPETLRTFVPESSGTRARWTKRL